MTAQGMELQSYKRTLAHMMEAGDLPLPSGVDYEAFRNAAIIAFTDNPDIAGCTPPSIFKALRKLAGMGLVPDGVEAALVPHKNKQRDGSWLLEATAMPMVYGLQKRARNSGEVRSLWADVIYQGEMIQMWIDDDGSRRWNHVNDDGSRINAMKRGGEVIGAIAVAKLADGTAEFEPMTRTQIDRIRAVSRMANGPAWSNWYEEMAKKSAIRRLVKRLPISAADRRVVLESDEDTIGMRDVTPKAAPVAEARGPSINYETQESAAAETAPGAEPEKPPRAKADKPAPEPKTEKPAPRQARKAEPEKAKEPEPKAEPENVQDAEVVDQGAEEGDAGLPDQLQSVYDRIMEDLQEADNPKSVQGIFDLFSDQIDAIKAVSEDHHAEIEQAFSDAFERTEAKG